MKRPQLLTVHEHTPDGKFCARVHAVEDGEIVERGAFTDADPNKAQMRAALLRVCISEAAADYGPLTALMRQRLRLVGKWTP